MEDYTDQAVQFIRERIVGHDVYKKVFFSDPSSDLFLHTATGSAEVLEATLTEGRLFKITIDGGKVVWLTDPDLVMSFRYKSETSAVKLEAGWKAPYEATAWEDQERPGTMTTKLQIIPNHKVTLLYKVEVDQQDEAGSFIKDNIVPLTMNKMEHLWEKLLGIPVEIKS